MNLARNRETTVAAEADIEQHEIGCALTDSSDGLRASRGRVDRYPFALEERPRSVDEAGVIVNQKAAQRHVISVSASPPGRNYR
jgi:hypothetical protein